MTVTEDGEVVYAPENDATAIETHFRELPQQAAKRGLPDSALPATRAQFAAIYRIARNLGYDEETANELLTDTYGLEHLDELTVANASSFLERLRANEFRDPAPKPTPPEPEAKGMSWTEFWTNVRGTQSLPTTQSGLMAWLGQDVHGMDPADAWALVSDKLAVSRAQQPALTGGK